MRVKATTSDPNYERFDKPVPDPDGLVLREYIDLWLYPDPAEDRDPTGELARAANEALDRLLDRLLARQ